MLRVVLAVEQRDKKLYARLTFTNENDHPVDLVKFVTLPSGRFDNNYFLIIDQQGRELNYRGMMKKRVPPREEGFYWLQPNESVSSAEVCLNDVYDIPKRGGLQLSYSSHNHFAGYDVELVSNPVTLVLSSLA